MKHPITLSILFAISSFVITFFLSSMFRYSIPYVIWPPQNREFKLDSALNVQNVSVLWSNFDTNYYMGIVRFGYDRTPFSVEQYKNWAFFPLYPMLVKLGGVVIGATTHDSYLYVGLVLSNIFLAISLFLIFKLLNLLSFIFSDWLIFVFILLSFPSSYFLHLFYTEALFLMLSLLVLYLTFIKRYFYALLFLILCSLVRFQGILLLFPFITHYLFFNGPIGIKRIFKTGIYTFLSASGIFGFFYYMHYLTGDFLAPIKIQQSWGRGGIVYPLKSIIVYLDYSIKHGNLFKPDWVLNIILILFSLALLVYFFVFMKDIKPEFKIPLGIYYFVYLIVSTGTSDTASIYRYFSVLFPFFLTTTHLSKRYPVFLYSLLFVFGVLHAFFLLLFVNKFSAPAYGF